MMNVIDLMNAFTQEGLKVEYKGTLEDGVIEFNVVKNNTHITALVRENTVHWMSFQDYLPIALPKRVTDMELPHLSHKNNWASMTSNSTTAITLARWMKRL